MFANTHSRLQTRHMRPQPQLGPRGPSCERRGANEKTYRTQFPLATGAWLNMHGHQLEVKSDQTCSHMPWCDRVWGEGVVWGCDLNTIRKHAQWQSITKHVQLPILFIYDKVSAQQHLTPQIDARVSHSTKRPKNQKLIPLRLCFLNIFHSGLPFNSPFPDCACDIYEVFTLW